MGVRLSFGFRRGSRFGEPKSVEAAGAVPSTESHEDVAGTRFFVGPESRGALPDRCGTGCWAATARECFVGCDLSPAFAEAAVSASQNRSKPPGPVPSTEGHEDGAGTGFFAGPESRLQLGVIMGLRRDKLRPIKGGENGLDWDNSLALGRVFGPHHFTCPGN